MFTAIGTVEKLIEKEKNGRKYYVAVINFGGDERATSFTDRVLDTDTEYLFIISADKRGVKISPICRAI